MEMSLCHASGIPGNSIFYVFGFHRSCCAPATHKKEPEGRICISNEDLPSTLQFGIAISEQNGLSTSCTLFFRKFAKRLAKKLGFRS